MTLAGKLYFDAISKIGESAAVSPVSRELGKFPCCLLALFWDILGDCEDSSYFPEIVGSQNHYSHNLHCLSLKKFLV